SVPTGSRSSHYHRGFSPVPHPSNMKSTVSTVCAPVTPLHGSTNCVGAVFSAVFGTYNRRSGQTCQIRCKRRVRILSYPPHFGQCTACVHIKDFKSVIARIATTQAATLVQVLINRPIPDALREHPIDPPHPVDQARPVRITQPINHPWQTVRPD